MSFNPKGLAGTDSLKLVANAYLPLRGRLTTLSKWAIFNPHHISPENVESIHPLRNLSSQEYP